jgi:ADP-ribosylglycohydrolase
MTLPDDHSSRLARARASLQGLSVGDAFGQRFFDEPRIVAQRLAARTLPPAPWSYTDDTVMAMSIVDVLADHGAIDRDDLAQLFAARYRHDPARGYGATAHRVLARVAAGEPWHEVAPSVFGGEGSMGNGGAMRAAPIGAYFCDDFDRAADAARASAQVTHAHAEGQAGAIAVAVAAAWAAAGGSTAGALFDVALGYTPAGETRAGIADAAQLPLDAAVSAAAAALGCGERVVAQDTVPFALWCAARHLGSFEEAMWATVSGLGDRDTTCAIVGGIVAALPAAEVPRRWIDAREPLERLARAFIAQTAARPPTQFSP